MHNGATPDGRLIVGLFTDMDGRGKGNLVDRGQFEPFEVPGAMTTAGWDINQAGVAVGVYREVARECRQCIAYEACAIASTNSSSTFPARARSASVCATESSHCSSSPGGSSTPRLTPQIHWANARSKSVARYSR